MLRNSEFIRVFQSRGRFFHLVRVSPEEEIAISFRLALSSQSSVLQSITGIPAAIGPLRCSESDVRRRLYFNDASKIARLDS